MNRILASFHTNTPASVAELHTALAAADWPAVAAVAHRLRPSLNLVGAARVAPHLATVESKDATDAERRAGAEGFIRELTDLLDGLPERVTA